MHVDSTGTSARCGRGISKQSDERRGQIFNHGFQACEAKFDEDEEVERAAAPQSSVVSIFESFSDL